MKAFVLLNFMFADKSYRSYENVRNYYYLRRLFSISRKADLDV